MGEKKKRLKKLYQSPSFLIKTPHIPFDYNNDLLFRPNCVGKTFWIIMVDNHSYKQRYKIDSQGLHMQNCLIWQHTVSDTRYTSSFPFTVLSIPLNWWCQLDLQFEGSFLHSWWELHCTYMITCFQHTMHSEFFLKVCYLAREKLDSTFQDWNFGSFFTFTKIMF